MKNRGHTYIAAIAIFLFSFIISLILFFLRDKKGVYIKKTTYGELYAVEKDPYGQKEKWSGLYRFHSKGEIDSAQQLASQEAAIRIEDKTFTKVVKIGYWLVNRFQHCSSGKPTDSLSKLLPLQQFDAIINNMSPIQCGNYGSMFMFFCRANAIDTRYIEIMNRGDHHVVNECYIPELNQWISVDLTYNILFSKDTTGGLLNTVDIINYFEQKSGNIILHQVKDGDIAPKRVSAQNIPWNSYLVSHPDLYFYYQTDPSKVYSVKQRIIRYLLPVSWFEVYSHKTVSNFWFFARFFFIVVTLISFCYLLTKFITRPDDRNKKY